MATATQKTTVHKRTTVKIKPKGVPAGNIKCNVCGGKGYYPKPKKGKK